MTQINSVIQSDAMEDVTEIKLIMDDPSFNYIPPNWRVATLGEVCQDIKESLNPQNFPEEAFEYYSIPAYQEQNGPILIEGKHILSTKLVVQNHTVLFGKLNPRVLKVWLVESVRQNRKIASTEFIPLLANGQVDPKFIYFLCQSKLIVSIAKKLISGSTPSRQRVDTKSFYQIPIPLPPLPEQRAVAHTLQTAQDTIQARRKEIQLERERKAALMHHLFTRGTRNEPTKQSEIGEIPESWEVVQLGEIIASGPKNGLYKHLSFYGQGVSIIRIDDFNNEGEIVTAASHRVILTPNELEEYRVYQNDILINRVNSISHLGKVTLVGALSEDSVFESNMMRLTVNTDVAEPDYVFRYLVSPSARGQIREKARRAVAQSSINQGDVRSVLLPLPPHIEQYEIASIFCACDSKITTLEKEVALHEELFRALLEELMTGRLSALPLAELEGSRDGE